MDFKNHAIKHYNKILSLLCVSVLLFINDNKPYLVKYGKKIFYPVLIVSFCISFKFFSYICYIG